MTSAARIDVELIDRITPVVRDLVARRALSLPELRYADARVEVCEARSASAENGASKASGADAALAFGIRVIAGRELAAPGYFGRGLGVADLASLEGLLRDALAAAYRRAMANAEQKATARAKFPSLGASLAGTALCPIAVRQAVVPAIYERDPREVPLGEIARVTRDVSRAVRAAHGSIGYDYVSAATSLRRELFASSEGALIDQSFALTQGLCYVVATGADGGQELYDVVGHQRGWEILERGVEDGALRLPPFATFSVDLAIEAAELAAAPALPTLDREVTVVTDPHYNTLVSHEIIGHPVELDRGLKMEAAYAGRSWLLRGLDDHQLGKRVASPLVSAYSDPALPGYGHYAFDHEGTPARRVVHIDRGIFVGFMNSRQTAAVFGGEPNGHWTATDGGLVPLVRMSSTVFASGDRPAADIRPQLPFGVRALSPRVERPAGERDHARLRRRRPDPPRVPRSA